MNDLAARILMLSASLPLNMRLTLQPSVPDGFRNPPDAQAFHILSNVVLTSLSMTTIAPPNTQTQPMVTSLDTPASSAQISSLYSRKTVQRSRQQKLRDTSLEIEHTSMQTLS